MPQRKAQKGKRTMPVVVTSSPADAGRPEHRRAPCSGNGGRLPKRLRARVPEADPCCERPLVHLAGYTSFVEPDGTVVYTKKTDSLIPKPMYSRETHEEAYRRMCERRLPRLTYEGLESDPGELTDSNDSEESMTPPDHAKGDSIMVHGKPCKTFRVEPHQRERVMQLLAEGVEASYTRAARKYERYLRCMHREAAAEQELGAAFTSLDWDTLSLNLSRLISIRRTSHLADRTSQTAPLKSWMVNRSLLWFGKTCGSLHMISF